MQRSPTEKGPNDSLDAISGSRDIADWQLPDGVSRGTWDYSQKPDIADGYDAYHREHPLLKYDQLIIEQFFPSRVGTDLKRLQDRQSGHDKAPNTALARAENDLPAGDLPLVIDLGCGTGRSILPLAERGYRTLGIDLSSKMLEVVRQKAIDLNRRHPHIPVDRVNVLKSNIVHLDEIESESAQGVLCLFSSFGMIQGRENRRQMLSHVHRILQPEGILLLHVHNRGNWWLDPKGPNRIFNGWQRAVKMRLSRNLRQFEMGDRVYNYRGIPNFFLHIYSRRELLCDLHATHLNVQQWIWLNRSSSGSLSHPWMLPKLRSGGMIVACRKS